MSIQFSTNCRTFNTILSHLKSGLLLTIHRRRDQLSQSITPRVLVGIAVRRDTQYHSAQRQRMNQQSRMLATNSLMPETKRDQREQTMATVTKGRTPELTRYHQRTANLMKRSLVLKPFIGVANVAGGLVIELQITLKKGRRKQNRTLKQTARTLRPEQQSSLVQRVRIFVRLCGCPIWTAFSR